MQLIAELEQQMAGEESLFRAQLLREDIARLARVVELASAPTDYASFSKAALRLGWTQGDARTNELAAPLDALLRAIYACCAETPDAAREDRVRDAWRELHRFRMERLVGCLSTPVPKPVD